eukprot:m.315073 g.315073  ORF g.315073 m.315073 type:complete len:462 (+) comp27516_c0_seq3:102-1487(+)
MAARVAGVALGVPEVADLGPTLPGETAEHRHIRGIKARLAELRARGVAVAEAAEAAAAARLLELHKLEADVAATKAELEAAVASPVPRDVDPTQCLADELMLAVLLYVVAESGTAVGGSVCRRWHALYQSRPLQRTLQMMRWAGCRGDSYECGQPPCRVFVGHAARVLALAVGPDGRVFSGSADSTVGVWSGVDGTLLQTLRGHEKEITTLAIDPGGLLYSGSKDCTIRVWSLANGAHLRTFERHRDHIMCLAAGTGGVVCSGTGEASIRVWQGDTGVQVRKIYVGAGEMRALALSPDGTLLHSASEEFCVRVWRVSDGSLLRLLDGHQGEIMALAVNAAGTVYSASNDGTVIMWSGVDGAIIDTLEHDRKMHVGYGSVADAAIMSMALGPDGAVYGGLASAPFHTSEVCRWCPRTGGSYFECIFDAGKSDGPFQGVNAMAVGENNVLYTAFASCGEFCAW